MILDLSAITPYSTALGVSGFGRIDLNGPKTDTLKLANVHLANAKVNLNL